MTSSPETHRKYQDAVEIRENVLTNLVRHVMWNTRNKRLRAMIPANPTDPEDHRNQNEAALAALEKYDSLSGTTRVHDIRTTMVTYDSVGYDTFKVRKLYPDTYYSDSANDEDVVESV